MPIDREALLRNLLASFQEEAGERLVALDANLPGWQNQAPTAEGIELVFREVHSLKGAAGAVGRSDLERVCHAWEAMLVLLRTGKQAFHPGMATVSLSTLAAIKRGLASEALEPAEVKRLCHMLERLPVTKTLDGNSADKAVLATAEPTPPATIPAPAPAIPQEPVEERAAVWRSQTLRVRAELCDQLAYQSEALLQAKLQAQALQRQLHGQLQCFEQLWQTRGRSVMLGEYLYRQLDQGEPINPERLRQLLDWQEESRRLIDQLHADAGQLRQSSNLLSTEMNSLGEGMSRTVADMLQLSCRSLLDELPALVQDLAEQTGKQATLKLPATQLLVDKRILDALRTPLLHLLRNALDHGIEPPQVRREAGKPDAGQLEVDIYQDSASHFCLLLRDDGGGIDPAKVRRKAEEIGLLKAGSGELEPQQLLNLVFESGLSTSPRLTNLSGRGVGLSIVREELEQLGGSIEVRNLPTAGTEFSIRLPMSRSSFRVVLFRCGEHCFGLPANAVSRTLRVPLDAVKQIENKTVIPMAGRLLPVWSLAEVLELAQPEQTPVMVTLLVIGEEPQPLAVQVDTMIGDQEITLKPLGKQLKRVRNILGATVLGDGTLVPILHPQDLYRSTLQSAGLAFVPRSGYAAPVKRRARILVAEDSFTSRGLLRALLETAGYEVQTANDGLDAWNALKQDTFDLLVSDIEMPRMDGFALTSKVRADRELATLPVVLITALHTAEDRARGLEAGANAYLVKGGLEQDTVLAAIKRLV